MVLSDVNFSLAEGEILGLIGPNGAGKTTLFNIISGMLKPDRGKVLFGGRNITGKAPHRISRMGIARTFHIPQPFPEMTVLENVRAASMFSHEGGKGRLPKDPAEICGLLGLGDELGSVEPGKRADLVLLEGDTNDVDKLSGRIVGVWKDGVRHR